MKNTANTVEKTAAEKKREWNQFHINEFAALCTDDNFMELITSMIIRGKWTRRERTDAEMQARADFYGLDVEDVAR